MGLNLQNGTASVATVSRILAGIGDELFLFAFMEWIGEILDTKGLHLAIDGKAVRAAASRVRGTKAPLAVQCGGHGHGAGDGAVSDPAQGM